MEITLWVTLRDPADDLPDISVWKIGTSWEHMLILHGHTGDVNSVCFRADHLQLASGSNDNTVKIWSLETGQEFRTLPHDSEVFSVEFNMGGDRLVSSARKTIYIWRLAGESIIVHQLPVTGYCLVALFNPLDENEIFASGLISEVIGVWNISDGKYRTSKATVGDVVCMAASPVGSKVACFFANVGFGVMYDFQLDTCVDLEVGDGHDASFDGPGDRLAVTSGVSVVILDATTAEQLLVIDCTTDFKRLMSIGWDSTSNKIIVTLWRRLLVFDAATGDKILDEHAGKFDSCAVRRVRHQVVLM